MKLPIQAKPVERKYDRILSSNDKVMSSGNCQCKRGKIKVDQCGGRYVATCYGKNNDFCKCVGPNE